MTAWTCISVVVVAGCNQIFGLKAVEAWDASDPHVACSHPGDAMYHDEDNDTFPDDCDNCPGIANAGQEDVLELANGQPADGVGDACDPAPSITGDKLFRFVTFAASSDMALVEPHNGSWTVSGDDLVIVTTSSAAIADASLAFTPPPMPYAVETHFVFDSVGNAPTITYYVGVFTNYMSGSNATGQGECEIVRRSNGVGHDDQVEAYVEGGGSGPVPLLNSQLADGAGYITRGTLRANSLDCRFDGDRGDNGSQSGLHQMIDGKIGFEALQVAARIHYLAVYDLSGEPAS